MLTVEEGTEVLVMEVLAVHTSVAMVELLAVEQV